MAGSTSTTSYQPLPLQTSAYNQLVNLSRTNYNNVLGSFNSAFNNINANAPGIISAYGDLARGVGSILGGGGGWGVAAPAAKAIERTAAAAQGQSQQQMINSGLGNSTVLANATNQNALHTQESYANLGAQLADKFAGYYSNIGLAGLGARSNILGMQTGLGQSMGSTLAGFHWPAPGQLEAPVTHSVSSGGGGGVSGSAMGGGVGGLESMLSGIGGMGGGGYGSIGGMGGAGPQYAMGGYGSFGFNPLGPQGYGYGETSIPSSAPSSDEMSD